MRRALALAVALAGGLFPLARSGAVLAQAADPVTEGQALVEMYCADCHAVGRTGDSLLPAAPRFRELYWRYDVEFLSEALVAGIVTAHPDMPQYEFDPEQAAAIVAYLKKLEPQI